MLSLLHFNQLVRKKWRRSAIILNEINMPFEHFLFFFFAFEPTAKAACFILFLLFLYDFIRIFTERLSFRLISACMYFIYSSRLFSRSSLSARSMRIHVCMYLSVSALVCMLDHSLSYYLLTWWILLLNNFK